MNKIAYLKLSVFLTLFLGVVYPTGTGAQYEPQFLAPKFNYEEYKDLPLEDKLEKELEFLRRNNSITLDYIKFKVKYGDYREYYKQQEIK